MAHQICCPYPSAQNGPLNETKQTFVKCNDISYVDLESTKTLLEDAFLVVAFICGMLLKVPSFSSGSFKG